MLRWLGVEQAIGDSNESMVVNDWLLVLASGDFRWSAAGDRQPRESAEVDGKLSLLALPAGDSVPDFFRGGSFPAS